LTAIVQGEDGALPGPVVRLASILISQITALSEQIEMLEKEDPDTRCQRRDSGAPDDARHWPNKSGGDDDVRSSR
jgi:hypothetical protein